MNAGVSRTGILQVTDSLLLGGAERVAVNLANALPRERFDVHLCTTRMEGPLSEEVRADVGRLVLRRSRRLDDLSAALRIARYIREQKIALVHCHKDTLFLSALACALGARPRILWHDHFAWRGRQQDRPLWQHKLVMRRTDGIVSVSRGCLEWATGSLGMPASRVWYVPNFVEEPRPCPAPPPLPGVGQLRIACAARLHPDKDQLNLVRAMSRVLREVPNAHALLLGADADECYASAVRTEIERLGIEAQVTLLGPRKDVTDVLQACHVGVLSSRAEGLPLALIEYGMCGLPSVATRVGQCASVLDEGRAGLLVEPEDPEALAQALLRLLQSADERARLGKLARAHAVAHHNSQACVRQIVEIYDELL